MVKPIDWVKAVKLPVVFLVGKEDNLAKPARVKDVFEKYGGSDKQFYLIEGTHQSARDETVLKKIVAFALRQISLDQLKTKNLRNISKETTISPSSRMASLESRNLPLSFKSAVDYHNLDQPDLSLQVEDATTGHASNNGNAQLANTKEIEVQSRRNESKTKGLPSEAEPLLVIYRPDGPTDNKPPLADGLGQRDDRSPSKQ